MVITHNVWDIRAIDAPVVASLPYADGKTTVLRPKGVANANKHILIICTSIFTSIRAPMNIKGKIISLKSVARYTNGFLKRDERLYFAATNPVSIIAIGPIQDPKFPSDKLKKDGTNCLIPVRPIIAPMKIEITLGLIRFLKMLFLLLSFGTRTLKPHI